MGSDSFDKSLRHRRLLCLALSSLSVPPLRYRALHLAVALAVAAITGLVVLLLRSGHRAGEVPVETLPRLPPRCDATLARFQQCQGTAQRGVAAAVPPVVLACHRQWCSSWGHCEPCAGIGDRTKHMVTLAQTALDRCNRIELDYPQGALQMPAGVRAYRDPAWFAELLHVRSYHISERKVNVNDWGHEDHPSVVHFFAGGPGLSSKPFDPCLFHLLHRPSASLQRRIEYHRSRMGPNVVGIHFRTGDVAAFAASDGAGAPKNSDVRARAASYEAMMRCAESLALRLFPDGGREEVSFFLATDSEEVKRLVKADDRWKVYMTDARPNSYLRSDEEIDAWLELYLLSLSNGLVMNVLPKGYGGTALRISQFAFLAKNMGFMSNEEVLECEL